MEPSAKMLALLQLLRTAEDAGDKTIVYSQCKSPLFCISADRKWVGRGNVLMMMAHTEYGNRDVDAGLVGDAVGATRDSELALRRQDAERGARGHAHRVPQGGGAQGNPDQYQVRRRRFEPHLREPCHQVRASARISESIFIFHYHFYIQNSMDLSWNYAAESQAYDRVHRLGQEKDVFVKRLVVENTIEERMLRLQDVKTGAHPSGLLNE